MREMCGDRRGTRSNAQMGVAEVRGHMTAPAADIFRPGEVREQKVPRRLADGQRDPNIPVVRDDPVVPRFESESRAHLRRLVTLAGDSERSLTHAVEHALALANGAC